MFSGQHYVFKTSFFRRQDWWAFTVVKFLCGCNNQNALKEMQNQRNYIKKKLIEETFLANVPSKSLNVDIEHIWKVFTFLYNICSRIWKHYLCFHGYVTTFKMQEPRFLVSKSFCFLWSPSTPTTSLWPLYYYEMGIFHSFILLVF